MIEQNVNKILDELPEGVELVAAAKARTPEQVKKAVEAGIEIVGENYVQEAQEAFDVLGKKARWHFIGHLQRNKVKKAIQLFDMIETLDSMKLAKEIEKRAGREGLVMPVLIEVNSGREEQKFGIFPEDVEEFARKIAEFDHLKLRGLMTMGPMVGDPENARPYFVETSKVFNKLKKLSISGVEMKYLSMGMTNSYKIAVEEGANIVRIGTKIFGPR